MNSPISPQLAFTCSKLTIETLEQSVKYVQVSNKDTRMMPMASFSCLIVNSEHISHLALVFLLLTLNMLMPTGSGNIMPNFFVKLGRTKKNNKKQNIQRIWDLKK